MPRSAQFLRTVMKLPTGPALRVLIYVDSVMFLGRYGTAWLQSALTADAQQMNIEVDVKLRDRLDELTPNRLKNYHEIWFFVFNTSDELRLTDDEVTALFDWMNRGGGVLVAGDHASETKGQDGVSVYKGLGTHVGGRVPRGGKMRAWDAAPGDLTAMADTTGADLTTTLADEEDSLPQRLLLPRHDGEYPHPIFRDTARGVLDRFPDHQHEGEVKKPDQTADKIEWPGDQPVRILAQGVSWRFGRTYDLLADWDGQAVKPEDPNLRFGRVLADSSFHHYVDSNLAIIARRGGEIWQEIQEIYRNEVAWLAPADVRKQYRDRALEGLLAHPYIREVAHASDGVVGTVARPLLAAVLPAAWYHELVNDLIAELNRQRPRTDDDELFDTQFIGLKVHQMLAAKWLEQSGQAQPEASASPGNIVDEALKGYEAAMVVRRATEARAIRLKGYEPIGENADVVDDAGE